MTTARAVMIEVVLGAVSNLDRTFSPSTETIEVGLSRLLYYGVAI